MPEVRSLQRLVREAERLVEAQDSTAQRIPLMILLDSIDKESLQVTWYVIQQGEYRRIIVVAVTLGRDGAYIVDAWIQYGLRVPVSSSDVKQLAREHFGEWVEAAPELSVAVHPQLVTQLRALSTRLDRLADGYLYWAFSTGIPDEGVYQARAADAWVKIDRALRAEGIDPESGGFGVLGVLAAGLLGFFALRRFSGEA